MYARLTQVRMRLHAIALEHRKTLNNLAIAWVLRQPVLTGAIIGIRSEQEALQMLDGLDWHLTQEEIQAISHALALWDESN